MSETQRGLVSTIITVYNRPRLVVEAVESVLAQTYPSIEIILVDDGSTDDTAAICVSLAHVHAGVVRHVRQAHAGFSRAVNTALPLVRGAFVQFLDSDDVLMPEKFDVQVRALDRNRECGIAYCYAREYPMGGPRSGRPARRTGEVFTELFPALLSGRLWPSPVPLYRREVIEQCGRYREWSVHREWEYECRAAVARVRLLHTPLYLVDVRGTHHLEGRQKGGVPPHKLKDYVDVLSTVVQHGRRANQPAAAFYPIARKLFAAAQLSAAAGFEAEARNSLALALDLSPPSSRRLIGGYQRLSDGCGWKPVARLSIGLERSRAACWARALQRWPGTAFATWRRRAVVARQVVLGAPVHSWPRRLIDRWRASHERPRPPANDLARPTLP